MLCTNGTSQNPAIRLWMIEEKKGNSFFCFFGAKVPTLLKSNFLRKSIYSKYHII